MGVGLAAVMGLLVTPVIGWRAVFLVSSASAAIAFVVAPVPAGIVAVGAAEGRAAVARRRRWRCWCGARLVGALAQGLGCSAVFKLGTYWTCYTWLPKFLQTELHQPIGRSALWMLTAQLGQFLGMMAFGYAGRSLRPPRRASPPTRCSRRRRSIRWRSTGRRCCRTRCSSGACSSRWASGRAARPGFGALLAELFPDRHPELRAWARPTTGPRRPVLRARSSSACSSRRYGLAGGLERAAGARAGDRAPGCGRCPRRGAGIWRRWGGRNGSASARGFKASAAGAEPGCPRRQPGRQLIGQPFDRHGHVRRQAATHLERRRLDAEQRHPTPEVGRQEAGEDRRRERVRRCAHAVRVAPIDPGDGPGRLLQVSGVDFDDQVGAEAAKGTGEVLGSRAPVDEQHVRGVRQALRPAPSPPGLRPRRPLSWCCRRRRPRRARGGAREVDEAWAAGIGVPPTRWPAPAARRAPVRRPASTPPVAQRVDVLVRPKVTANGFWLSAASSHCSCDMPIASKLQLTTHWAQ